MALHPLVGAYNKLYWAEEHLHALYSEIRSWREANTEFTTASQFYPEANVIAVYAQVPNPPLRWGVMLGNIVHNARSALDHLVWQLVLANDCSPRAGPRGNSFPIFTRPLDAAEFAAKTVNSLGGVSNEAKRRIELLQPYKRPNGLPIEDHPLTSLDQLWNQDKHRILEPLAFGLTEKSKVMLSISEGSGEWVDGGTILGREHGLKNDGVVAWVEIASPGPNPQAAIHGPLPIDIGLSDGRILLASSSNIVESLKSILGSFRAACF